MKVLIGGSKSIYDPRELLAALKSTFHQKDWLAGKEKIKTIISGGEKGVDRLAINYARRNEITALIFTPKINKEQTIREMVKQADCGIILWDGKSIHTGFLINEFQRTRKPFYVHYAVPTACYKNGSIREFYKKNSGGR